MEIQVGNKTLEVTLLSKEGNQVKIDIDGKVFDVDVAMLQNGTCSLIYDGNSYNAELIRESGEKHYRVNLNYSTYQIDMLDSQAKYMKMRRGGSLETVQADVIAAPMPCKIVNIYVKPGDELKAGDTVLTMEAMKMQSNYKVSADCAVKDILVNVGDSVRVEQALIRLELKKKDNE
ncbi:MAG: acetyl-CoA carboxylase biotin carboxyl carrier protein subunit [Bacteroidaceae bacterium]|nr:acetyl-CoA carboxylase biotin carboxyl carrier protein subunit [Bacteroidaceae bacterium]